MQYLNFIQSLQEWSDQYPWLEMLTSFSILIIVAGIATFIAKQFVVKGIRKLVSKISGGNSDVVSQYSVIRRISNIVPAVIIMNGIVTVPHLSDKAENFIQMGAQAFIFLTIALAIAEFLNIFNVIYQKIHIQEISQLKDICN